MNFSKMVPATVRVALICFWLLINEPTKAAPIDSPTGQIPVRFFGAPPDVVQTYMMVANGVLEPLGVQLILASSDPKFSVKEIGRPSAGKLMPKAHRELLRKIDALYPDDSVKLIFAGRFSQDWVRGFTYRGTGFSFFNLSFPEATVLPHEVLHHLNVEDYHGADRLTRVMSHDRVLLGPDPSLFESLHKLGLWSLDDKDIETARQSKLIKWTVAASDDSFLFALTPSFDEARHTSDIGTDSLISVSDSSGQPAAPSFGFESDPSGEVGSSSSVPEPSITLPLLAIALAAAGQRYRWLRSRKGHSRFEPSGRSNDPVG